MEHKPRRNCLITPVTEGKIDRKKEKTRREI
jgi:hypothetical protein